MFLAVLIALLVLLTTILYLVHKLLLPRPLPNVYIAPGYLPVIGHLLTLYVNRHRLLQLKLYHARHAPLGSTAYQYLVLGVSHPLVELLTPAGVEWLLKEEMDAFGKGNLERYGELLGGGIFAVDGDEWRKQRKVLSQLFSHRRLASMTAACQSQARLLCERLLASDGGVVDLHSMCSEYTLESLLAGTFPDATLPLSSGERRQFAASFDRAHELCTRRFALPGWLWKLRRRMRLGEERELVECVRSVHASVDKLVQWAKQRKQQRDEDDIVMLFVRDAERRGERCSDNYLRDVLINYLLAGRDTTATALTWLFYRLARYPHCLERVLTELQSPLPAPPYSAPVDFYPSSSCHPYLLACLHETLRLHPPVPSDAKRAVRCVRLPGRGCVLPAGTYCFYSPYTLQRSEQRWGDDSEQFKPERWLHAETAGELDPSWASGEESKEVAGGWRDCPMSAGKATGERLMTVSAYDFPVFNAGPRTCLGKQLALREMSVLAAEFVQSFEWQLVEAGDEAGVVDDQPALRLGLVAAMRDGLRCIVTPRAIHTDAMT